MLGNLRNPPEPFRSVILNHFRMKAPELQKQLDDWLALDDGKPLEADGALSAAPRNHRGASGSSSAFRKDVQDLKAALRKLASYDEDIPPAAPGTATPDPAPVVANGLGMDDIGIDEDEDF